MFGQLLAFHPWKPLKGRSEQGPVTRQEQKCQIVKYKDTHRPRSTGYRPSVPWASYIQPRQLRACPSFLQVWPVPGAGARGKRWSTLAWTVFLLRRREQDRYIKAKTKAWLPQAEEGRGDSAPQ